MQYDAESKSYHDNEFGVLDWNLLNEALLDDDAPGYQDGSSSEQSYTPTSQDLPKPLFSSFDRKFSGEESKTKSTKRKRDNLQDHIKALEEQNKIMRRALAEYNITPDELLHKQNTRLATFRRLIELFNTGDVLQLTNFLLHMTTPDCLLLTPSLFQELHGKNAAIQFWTLILEAFPDGLFQLSDTAYEENGFVATRFTFTGTKVSALPSDVLLHRWARFRDMMAAMRASTSGSQSNPRASQEANAATFRDLCTNDMVPTTSGPFIPRGLGQGEIPEAYAAADYLPYHHNAAAAAANLASSPPATSHIKTERISPGGNDQPFSSSLLQSAPNPLSIGVPTLRLTGYMTVTFNSMNLISRYIFVWNTASLIGQILGLSNGDLEAMSQYFNTPASAPSASSK